jgi:hypothetical protein
MASRIEFAVSATPVATVAAGENVTVDTIAADIGKSLGGSANVVTAHTTLGYGSATVAYGSVPANGGAKFQIGADATTYKFVFIKNPGALYSSPTALGASSESELKVHIETTAGSAWQQIASIPKGGAIILPNFVSQGSDKGLFVESSGSDIIAVEYITSI